MARFHLFLADAILVAHTLMVLFNVTLLPVIWLGALLNWKWVRNLRLRIVHLLLIAFVTLQALAGEICPLTRWENALRRSAGQGDHYAQSFVSHWVQRLIYYEAEPWVFNAAYLTFFVLTVLTLITVRPLRSGCGCEKMSRSLPS